VVRPMLNQLRKQISTAERFDAPSIYSYLRQFLEATDASYELAKIKSEHELRLRAALSGQYAVVESLGGSDHLVGLARAVAECGGSLLTPRQVAKQLRSSPDTVLGWIKSGQLAASNLATRGRPRYVVTPEAMTDFLKRRQPTSTPKPRRRKSSFKRY
jgi:hypothetical protein